MGVHHPLYFLAVATRACHRLCFCDLRGCCDSPKQTPPFSPFDEAGKRRKSSSLLEHGGTAWRLGVDSDSSPPEPNTKTVILRNIDPLSAGRRGGTEDGSSAGTGTSRVSTSSGGVGSPAGLPSSSSRSAERRRPMSTTSAWEELPNIIMAKVLPGLGSRDQAAFRRVCKSWNNAHSDNMKVIRPGQFDPGVVSALFPMLLSLDLSRCETEWRTAAGLASLTLFTSLKSLNLSGWSAVSLSTVVAMRSMPTLTTVRLVRCPKLGETALGELAVLPRLALLSIAECHGVNDQGLSRLAAAPCLTSLDLGRCIQVTDAGVAALTAMRNLMILNLGGCLRITDTGVACLSRVSSLASLRLAGCSLVTDSGLGCLARLMNLKRINLAGCSMVSDAGVAELASLNAPTNISLAGCRWVSDAGVATLARHLPMLASLNLTYCKLITDVALHHLAHLHELRSLVLDGCRQISDVGLEAVAKLRALNLLTLAGCLRITDHGVAALSALHCLNHLDISACSSITDAGLDSLSALPLTYLDVTYCERVSEAAVGHIRARNPSLHVRQLDAR